jgi:hypothetical protein
MEEVMVVRISLFVVVFLATILLALGFAWAPFNAFTSLEALAIRSLVVIGMATCVWITLHDAPFATTTSAVRKG